MIKQDINIIVCCLLVSRIVYRIVNSLGIFYAVMTVTSVTRSAECRSTFNVYIFIFLLRSSLIVDVYLHITVPCPAFKVCLHVIKWACLYKSVLYPHCQSPYFKICRRQCIWGFH
ncbi:hypothetical protein QTP88_008754 [Uroleucon formosanum]